MMEHRIERSIQVSPSSTMLHMVGRCGLRAEPPPGYELVEMCSEDQRIVWTYELIEVDLPEASHP